MQSPLKNSFFEISKPVYVNCKCNSVCTTKIKARNNFIAIPHSNGTTITILERLSQTNEQLENFRIDSEAMQIPLGQPVHIFEWSKNNILSTAGKSDGKIMLWNINQPEIPFSILCGHEKRVETLRFSEMCSNLIFTGSIDSTVRMWDYEQVQEICLFEGDPSSQCISLDVGRYENVVIAGYSDGQLSFYDPRTVQSVCSLDSGHNPAKSIKVSGSIKDHLFFSSGFDSKGERMILRIDLRNPKQIEGVFLAESHSSILQPYWDPSIPVLYAVSKNDGIRVIGYSSELTEMPLVAFPPSGKKFSGVDLLSKTTINGAWDAAKFIALTVENTIETLTLTVPRKKDETSKNIHDLYPTPVEENISVKEWQYRKRQIGTIEESPKVALPVVQLQDCTVEKLLRGWIYSSYVQNILLLTKDFLLISDSLQQVWEPISLGNLVDVGYHNNDSCLLTVGCDIFKFPTKEIAATWLQKIREHVGNGMVILSMKMYPRVLVTSILISQKFEFSSLKNSKTVFIEKFLALTDDQLILVYRNERDFLQQAVPEEAIPLHKLMAIYFDEIGMSLVLLQRSYHFRGDNFQEWIEFLDPTKKFCRQIIKKSFIVVNGVNSWVVIMESAIIQYFSDRWATLPTTAYNSEEIFGEIETNNNELILNLKGTALIHEFQSVEMMDEWVNIFQKIIAANQNILQDLGIELENGISDAWNDSVSKKKYDGIIYFDSKSRNELSLKYMYRIMHQKGLYVDLLPISTSHFSEDSCIVVESQNEVLLWNGKHTSRILIADANHIQQDFRKCKGNRPKIVVPLDENYNEIFKKIFGEVPPSSVQEKALNINLTIKLLALDFESKNISLISEGVLPKKELLRDCSILQTSHEIFLWIGSSSSSEFRQYARLVSFELARSMKTKDSANIYHFEESEGMESVYFKRKFKDFSTELPIGTAKYETTHAIAKAEAQDNINLELAVLIQEECFDSELLPENGELQQYLIHSFEKILVSKNDCGILLSNKSYVFSYTYTISGKKKSTLYFWQGNLSPVIEKGTSAMITVEMSKSTGHEINHYRVLEGKEPKSFLELFGGLLIIRKSLKPLSEMNHLLFDVREHEGTAKAYELGFDELSPKRTLLYISKHKSIIGASQESTNLEKTKCTEIIQKYGSGANISTISLIQLIDILLESKFIDNSFFNFTTLGGDSSFFRTSSVTGAVNLFQIQQFTQFDLLTTNVAILKTSRVIYVWIGDKSNWIEQKLAIEAVMKLNMEIVKVTLENQEPLDFKQEFHGWTLERVPQDKRGMQEVSIQPSDYLKMFEPKEYSRDELLNAEKVPQHLDLKNLENYLSQDEFNRTFSMKKSEYFKLPLWKRQTLKKAAGF